MNKLTDWDFLFEEQMGGGVLPGHEQFVVEENVPSIGPGRAINAFRVATPNALLAATFVFVQHVELNLKLNCFLEGQIQQPP